MSGYSCGTPSRAACPAMKACEIALSMSLFCCGVYGAVNSRRIPRSLQKSTSILFKYSVPLSVRNARGIPISALKCFTTEKMGAALFSRDSYGRCRRKALSTNITTYRNPPREVKVERCRCETSSPVKWITCYFTVTCSTLAWARAREMCNCGHGQVFKSTSLPCFSGPGVREAAARGVSTLHSDLEGLFSTNWIFSNTELRGGKEVCSSTVTAPGTFESCTPVVHMFLRGWGSCGGGGIGCRKCLRRLVAHMSPCLRLAPTVPTGSRVDRKYDLLLLRGNVRIFPMMCVPEASDTIRCVLWTACSEYRLNPKPGTYATSIYVIL